MNNTIELTHKSDQALTVSAREEKNGIIFQVTASQNQQYTSFVMSESIARRLHIFLGENLSVICDGVCPRCEENNMRSIACDVDYFADCNCGHRYEITRGCYTANT